MHSSPSQTVQNVQASQVAQSSESLAPTSQVVSNTLLTPKADKAIYWLELTMPADQSYQPGDWVVFKGQNPSDLVARILQALQISADSEVNFGRLGTLPAGEALLNQIEITQLNPAILNKLQRQFGIGQSLWPNRTAMMAYAEGRDVLDLVENFAEIRDLGAGFLALLSPLAPRYYSIASAPVAQKLAVLYRRVEYSNAGRIRQGVTSNWLANQQEGDAIHCEVKQNPTFKLPAGHNTPIIMIASGTGLAPFLGFIQQRIAQNATQNWLFFGETDPQTSCLKCEQLQSWQDQGVLNLHLAFSRVAPKAYVQDVLNQQREAVWLQWQAGAVVYLCGSQTKMAVGVEQFWLDLFCEKLGMDLQAAQQFWQQMRREKRIQMDVY